LAAIGLLLGCGDKNGGRFEVSGTVKFKNQPLKSGIVIFEPLEGQSTGGNVTLVEGAFTIPRTNGLKPGKYLVRVTAPDGTNPINPPDPNEGPGPTGGRFNIMAKDLIPADWNTKSKQQITVIEEGPNRFDFDIK
jgi:hypothetical protein